jgi:hypothetical protein
MSNANNLARLGLLDLENDPETLVNALYYRRLLLDNSTEEDLKKQNAWHEKRGNNLINIPGYMKDRETARRKCMEDASSED